MRQIITTIVYSAVFLLYMSLSSCRSHKSLAEPVQNVKDSFRIEYRERVEYISDTVYIQIPLQEREIIKKDTFSLLENDFALSIVRLYADGSMMHKLSTKPQLKPVPTEKKIEYRDSIAYRDRIVTETKTEYVEHKRSWWEQTQIYGFWASVIFFAVTYRKKIFQAVVRLFTRK